MVIINVARLANIYYRKIFDPLTSAFNVVIIVIGIGIYIGLLLTRVPRYRDKLYLHVL